MTSVAPKKGRAAGSTGKNWSFDFARDLPAGIVCEFSLKSGIKALSGTPVAGKTIFSFSTGGPAIKGANPREGRSEIDEKQIFVVVLDAPAQEESIIKNVYFSVEGIKEQVGIRLIKGKEREDILQSIAPRGKDGNDAWISRIQKRIVHEKVEDGSIVLLQAKQRFPSSAEVKLIWGRGVMSASSVATAEDQVLAYKTRASFKAEFSCGREKAGLGCIPVLPMRVYFTAPVPVKLAKQIVLKSRSGKTWKPRFNREEEVDSRFIYSVLFPGPFPEKTAFSVVVPKKITDDAGRTLSNLEKFPLDVSTHTNPPLAKFSSRFGIIEAKGDRLLPVTVRNIEADIKNRILKVMKEDDDKDVEASEGKAIEKETPVDELSGKVEQQMSGKIRLIPADREERVIDWPAQGFPGPRVRNRSLREAKGSGSQSRNRVAARHSK